MCRHMLAVIFIIVIIFVIIITVFVAMIIIVINKDTTLAVVSQQWATPSFELCNGHTRSLFCGIVTMTIAIIVMSQMRFPITLLFLGLTWTRGCISTDGYCTRAKAPCCWKRVDRVFFWCKTTFSHGCIFSIFHQCLFFEQKMNEKWFILG